MFTGKSYRLVIFFTVMVLISACKPQAQALPEGKFSRTEITGSGSNTLDLVLQQGHFIMNTSQYGLMADGSYTIAGDNISFKEEKTGKMADAFCGQDHSYTYQWSFDSKANQLTFKAVNETCPTRGSGMAGGAWSYSKLSQSN